MDNRNKNLILVSALDDIVGTQKAIVAHHKKFYRLHRAFSVFVFDKNNRLLLQRRSNDKLVFPGIWGNSCCSHPFLNDLSFTDPILDVKLHAIKRLEYELGMKIIDHRDLFFVGRVYYEAVDNNETSSLVSSPISIAEPKKVVEIGFPEGFEFTRDDFCEHEVDYVLAVKTNARIKPNPSEVQDTIYIGEHHIKEFFEGHENSPWLRSILKNINIFEVAKTLPSVCYDF